MDSPEEEINLYFKVIKTIAMKVKQSETIENLKAKLQEEAGISDDIQELFFAGDHLKDGQRILDYGVPRNSTVHLVCRESSRMRLYFKMPSNEKVIELQVLEGDTIQKIKSIIQDKEGICPLDFELYYSGRLLEVHRTVASLNIQNEGTLQMISNPKDTRSISVQTPTEGVIKVDVRWMHTVLDVKKIIESMINIPSRCMKLFVNGTEEQLEDCKTLACYDVDEDDILTIQTSLEAVGCKTDSSVSSQNLSNAGNKLEDSNTMACYNIIKGKSISELLSPEIQIFVKTWNGKTTTLDVQLSSTIKDVKSKLFEKYPIPLHLQSIVFGGKRLEEERDLASYNVQKHSTLHMVVNHHSNVVRKELSEFGNALPVTTTISKLKDLAKAKWKVAINKIEFQGTALEDEYTLADYGLVTTSFVDFVL